MCLFVTKGAFLVACPNQVCHDVAYVAQRTCHIITDHIRLLRHLPEYVFERLILPVCYITLNRRQLQKDFAIRLFHIYCSPPGLIISQDVIGHRWNSFLSICAPASFLCCHFFSSPLSLFSRSLPPSRWPTLSCLSELILNVFVCFCAKVK